MLNKQFNYNNPSEHFYLTGFRFDKIFSQLVLSLCDRSSSSIEANFTEKTATRYRKYRYKFENADIVTPEIIHSLKSTFIGNY